MNGTAVIAGVTEIARFHYDLSSCQATRWGPRDDLKGA
jgi:hypothetical protein